MWSYWNWTGSFRFIFLIKKKILLLLTKKKKKKHSNFQQAHGTFPITLCFWPSRGRAFNLPRPGTLWITIQSLSTFSWFFSIVSTPGLIFNPVPRLRPQRQCCCGVRNLQPPSIFSTGNNTNKYSPKFSFPWKQSVSARVQSVQPDVVCIVPAFNSLKQFAEMANRMTFCGCRTTRLPYQH